MPESWRISRSVFDPQCLVGLDRGREQHHEPAAGHLRGAEEPGPVLPLHSLQGGEGLAGDRGGPSTQGASRLERLKKRRLDIIRGSRAWFGHVYGGVEVA